jgi:hypothetical protein
VAIQLNLVAGRVLFKRCLVLGAREEILEPASRYFVFHVSLDLFALREHHRVETFERDHGFGSWRLGASGGYGTTNDDDQD